MSLLLELAAIFLLDFLLSEACLFVHPIVLLGKLVSFLEKKLRALFRCEFSRPEEAEVGTSLKRRERAAGVFLVVIVCAVSYGVPFAILRLVRALSPLAVRALQFFIGWSPAKSENALSVFSAAICVWMGYRCVAAKCLFDEAMNVFRKLGDSLGAGRAAVGRIVGRETGCLDEAGVVRACVETVAENTTDGIFSPIFFYIIGGAPLSFLYKAVNTMDSMVGYKNARYRFFGTAAARLDDAMNFLPARLCAVCMILTQLFSPARFFRAWRIFFRDRNKHESPNAAQTESVMAGILGVSLGGPSVYEGNVEEKETLGDSERPIARGDIKKSLRVMYGSCAVFFVAVALVCVMFRYRPMF